jgi:hypothetical protein
VALHHQISGLRLTEEVAMAEDSAVQPHQVSGLRLIEEVAVAEDSVVLRLQE